MATRLNYLGKASLSGPSGDYRPFSRPISSHEEQNNAAQMGVESDARHMATIRHESHAQQEQVPPKVTTHMATVTANALVQMQMDRFGVSGFAMRPLPPGVVLRCQLLRAERSMPAGNRAEFSLYWEVFLP